jgi:hypothetical protein
MTNATGVEKGLSYCGGKLISCGYDQNKQPLYCFGQAATPSCVYDYQKNACTGSCREGYSCTLVASKKDDSGKIVYAACRCTGQQATPCAFDYQKNECTGSCQTGAACVVTGKEVDEKTGAVSVTCGCPEQSSCTYDYSREACAGTCPADGGNCQLNTIYRDPATGKVTYAECHCKGAGDSCACDAATGSCTGTCASGQACSMTGRTVDNSGKVVCSSCGCAGSCVLTANNECTGTCASGEACSRIVYKDDSGNEKVGCGCGGLLQTGTPAGVASRPQGIFESIGDFFSRLFGRK